MRGGLYQSSRRAVLCTGMVYWTSTTWPSATPTKQDDSSWSWIAEVQCGGQHISSTSMCSFLKIRFRVYLQTAAAAATSL